MSELIDMVAVFKRVAIVILMHRSGLAVLLWIVLGVSVLPAATLEDLEQRLQRGDNTVMAELETLLQHEPQNYQVRFLQARLLSQQGHRDAAIKAYRQLIQQHPAQPEAYNNLAGLLARQGDLAGAQQLLEQALNTNPSYAAVYQNLSAIYVEQARTSYGKALRLEQNTTALTLAELTQIATAPPRMPTAPTTLATLTSSASPVATAFSTPAKTDTPTNETTHRASATVTPTAAINVNTQPPVDVASVKATQEVDQQQLITTLEGWAAAWSGKAPELYLSFYAKDFSPPGSTRTSWEALRRVRLTEPTWIKVGLSDIEVKPINAKRARVRFIQEYQSDGYRDRIRKEIVMQYTIDGWRIIAERKIAALH